jgi:hypothetical protein
MFTRPMCLGTQTKSDSSTANPGIAYVKIAVVLVPERGTKTKRLSRKQWNCARVDERTKGENPESFVTRTPVEPPEALL